MKRTQGEGTVDARGPGAWRLRYRANGRRVSIVFHGTKVDAYKKLRTLLNSVDIGAHVVPDKITVAQWIEKWLALIERRLVSPRTSERYGQLLRRHVVPKLGATPLQKLHATQIDAL
jgi:integrase